MWLHVRVGGAEQFLQALAGQVLGLIDEFATTVVAFRRVAFRILVGQNGPLRLHHPRAGIVLRGDQLDVLFLPHALCLDRIGQFVVVSADTVFQIKHSSSCSSLGRERHRVRL